MTNGLAIFLGVVIVAFVAIDTLAFDWALSLDLARRFAALLRWTAFWR